MREEGYYWVRKYDWSDWEIMSFGRHGFHKSADDPIYWKCFDNNERYSDGSLFLINETRILPPQN